MRDYLFWLGASRLSYLQKSDEFRALLQEHRTLAESLCFRAGNGTAIKPRNPFALKGNRRINTAALAKAAAVTVTATTIVALGLQQTLGASLSFQVESTHENNNDHYTLRFCLLFDPWRKSSLRSFFKLKADSSTCHLLTSTGSGMPPAHTIQRLLIRFPEPVVVRCMTSYRNQRIVLVHHE